MYFLDRELMEEFVLSPAMSPDFGGWYIREKAAQGLTLVNVPKGYTSRNIVLIDAQTKTVAQESWIHHLPNSYVNNPATLHGKLPVEGNGLFVTGLLPCCIQFGYDLLDEWKDRASFLLLRKHKK
jgi:hypothetical protein